MKKFSCIVGALSISLFIYLFYRSEKTVVNQLAILLLSFDTYTTLKNFISHTILLNEMIIYSLPGGLWLFCVTVLSKGFYIKIKTYDLSIIFAPLLFAVGLEFFQLIHLTNGRFDIWDLISYILFWLLAYDAFHSQNARHNQLSPFRIQGFICLVCFVSVYLAHVNP